jgi:hypothetical protein
VDVLSEEDSDDLKHDGVYISSAFSVKKAEYEVSLVCQQLCGCCCIMYLCSLVQVILNMTLTSENAHNGLMYMNRLYFL